MNRLANVMAIFGGIVLLALIILVCISVLGRSLNTLFHGELAVWFPRLAEWVLASGIGPINGDFEIVESGIAFSIFAFLPLCQITMGHASVDIFTARLPLGVNWFLQMVIDIVFAAVLILIAVQLFDGMQSKMRNGQTTFLLQFPIWWAYAACFGAAIVACCVSLFCAVAQLTGRPAYAE